jgi:hypothetical protein
MPKQRSKQTIRGLPRTNSNAPSPGPWSVVWTKQRRRKGPEPGTLDRFGGADRALYGDLKRLMSEKKMSLTAAAQELAEAGKVAGDGTTTSRARRLARRFSADSRRSDPPPDRR